MTQDSVGGNVTYDKWLPRYPPQAQPRPQLREGMRVRIVLGDRIDLHRLERQPYINWCGGIVPVGTEGTIYRTPDMSAGMWAIHFDGITPRSGWYFGLLGPTLSEQFEALDHGPCAVCGAAEETQK